MKPYPMGMKHYPGKPATTCRTPRKAKKLAKKMGWGFHKRRTHGRVMRGLAWGRKMAKAVWEAHQR